MKTVWFRFGLFAVLFFYSLLYLATKKIPPCDGICEKIANVDNSLRKDRPYVIGSYQCRDSVLCILVKDSVQQNWNVFADTACMYLSFQSLAHYRTVVLNQRHDTLFQKKCP